MYICIYIYIFKLVPWRKVGCIGFWVASKLSEVSFEGAESRWGDDLVSVRRVSCDGQRFKQQDLKGLYGARTRNYFTSSNSELC